MRGNIARPYGSGEFVTERPFFILITIGLTGGIASGKTVVSEMLRELGAYVIDADKVGHLAYAPGTRGWDEVVGAFGREIVGPDGAIDRKKLGPIVFGSPEALQRLNGILHPRMRDMIESEFDSLRREGMVRVALLEAAILIEAGWTTLVDEVWVTVVPEEVAMERLIHRNGFTAEAAQARIRSQIGNDERLKHADRIIDTNCTFEEVRTQVERLWAEIEARAGSATIPS